MSSTPLSSNEKSLKDLSNSNKVRLQKVIAQAGVASRRHAELLILQGAVTVNGRTVTTLGTKVDPERDKIKVNGKLILLTAEPIYMALYKPAGVFSTLSDPEGRPDLRKLLRGIRERVVPIGQMDVNSEGLLLLTNDGAIAEKIIKNKSLKRTYQLKVKGHLEIDDLEFLSQGLRGEKNVRRSTGVLRVESFDVQEHLRNKSWIRIVVKQGAQLNIREMFNRKGIMVDRIVRTAIGGVDIEKMPQIRPGDFVFLRRRDFEELTKTLTHEVRPLKVRPTLKSSKTS